MKLEVTESNNQSLSFTLKGAKASYANAVRRSAMNAVSTFAIDRVTFYENTSAIFDEYIAHRLGLIPLHTPSKGYGEKDEILFTLDATGPKTVYSSELESSDKEIKVAIDNIPVIKLGEGQRLRLDGKAILGQGKRHSKFQAGLVTYEEKNGDYNFYIETYGQMPPKEILNKAFDAIKEELKDLEKEAKKL